jgi:hypothetical protein
MSPDFIGRFIDSSISRFIGHFIGHFAGRFAGHFSDHLIGRFIRSACLSGHAWPDTVGIAQAAVQPLVKGIARRRLMILESRTGKPQRTAASVISSQGVSPGHNGLRLSSRDTRP